MQNQFVGFGIRDRAEHRERILLFADRPVFERGPELRERVLGIQLRLESRRLFAQRLVVVVQRELHGIRELRVLRERHRLQRFHAHDRAGALVAHNRE
jgi:hypothetical protein